MTDAERKLLVWCAIMLVRDTPVTSAEADEIDQLIADVRSPLPRIEWDTPNCGRVLNCAAPALYAALRRLLATVNPGNAAEHEPECRCVIHEAHTALAQARGEN